MNRFLRWGAAIVVGVTAWVGLSRQLTPVSLPIAGGQQKAPTSMGKRTVPKTTLSKEIGCDGVEESLQKFFLIDSKSVNAPDYCFDGPPTVPTFTPGTWARASNAHYMIALMPDPIHTHMAATFDQWMESMEHAAEAENFAYDSSWLPWRDADAPGISLGDNLRAAELRGLQEQQPGVVFFRSAASGGAQLDPYSNGLVVFVVGEQATAGINKKQFENAISWMQQLEGKLAVDRLQILGPFASGSFSSLEDLLNQKINDASYGSSLQIASGSVSSGPDITRFNTAMRSRLKWGADPRQWGKMVTFNESTNLEIQRYLRLLALEGYKIDRVAVVGEDETRFGSTFLDNSKKTQKDPRADADIRQQECETSSEECLPGLTLRYPRDIASLRSAYQKQGLMGADVDKAEYASQQRLLTQDLEENSDEADDTPKVYSGIHRDISDEAELLQLVLQLKQQHIQYVFLISTNSLDQIFLTHFLRATDPSVRIVILTSDQLLFRERGAGGLRGVLILSPYPLIPEVQAWTTDPAFKDKPIYTTDTAQGVYYAMRLLLRASASGVTKDNFLPGYAAPFWMDKSPSGRIPPTWLAVISGGKPWPMAAMDEWSLDRFARSVHKCHDTVAENGELLMRPLDLLALDHATMSKNPWWSPTLEVPVDFIVAVFACVFWMLLHLWFRCKASVIHKPRVRAYFALTTWWQHAVVLNLSWACIGLVAASLFRFSFFAVSLTSRSLYLEILLILVILVCAVFPFFDWRRNLDDYLPGRKGMAVALISPIVILCYLGALHFVLPGPNEATTPLEHWRGMHLLSGVSPAMPFVLLAIGGSLWCLQNLHGLALFNEDQPKLPPEEKLLLDLPQNYSCKNRKEADVKMRRQVLKMFADEAYETGKIRGLPMTRRVVLRMLRVLAVLVVIAITLQLGIRVLGVQSLGIFYEFVSLIAIAITLTEAYQLWEIWRSLQDLLGFLDRLPLRRTLRGIRAFPWSSVWAMGGTVLSGRYEMLSRQFETMSHLSRVWKEHRTGADGVPYNDQVQKALEEMAAELGCSFGPWFAANYSQQGRIDLTPVSRMQEKIASTTAALMTHVLLPAWRFEKKSLIVNYSADKYDTAADGHQADYQAESRCNSPLVRVAEEFVCLNYLAFIQNMMGRIRTLITGTTVLFVATAMSSSAYPFDPQPMLASVFSVIVVFLAGTVILVYAQAHRDATLSNITNTTPGALGGDFYIKVVQFALGPALGLISVVFPSIANLLFVWLQPGQMK